MHGIQQNQPRGLVKDRLDGAGRGYPVAQHSRSAGQELLIAQSRRLFGCYDSLLQHITPYPSEGPDGAMQNFVEVATRLSAATTPSPMVDANDTSPMRLQQLRLATESGIYFIVDALDRQLAPDSLDKASIRQCGHAIIKAMDKMVPRDAGQEIFYQLLTLHRAPHDPLAAERSSETQPKTEHDNLKQELVDCIRDFVRVAKPYFTDRAEGLMGSLVARTCDLHNLVFRPVDVKEVRDRKAAFSAAAIFSSHYYLLSEDLAPQKILGILYNVKHLLQSSEALLLAESRQAPIPTQKPTSETASKPMRASAPDGAEDKAGLKGVLKRLIT